MLVDILIIIFKHLNIKLKVMELFSYNDLLISGVIVSHFFNFNNFSCRFGQISPPLKAYLIDTR